MDYTPTTWQRVWELVRETTASSARTRGITITPDQLDELADDLTESLLAYFSITDTPDNYVA